MVVKIEGAPEANQSGDETMAELYARYAGVNSFAGFLMLNSGEAAKDAGWTDFLKQEGILKEDTVML